MTISFPLQDVMHERHMILISQWDLSIAELILQRAVEEAEEEVVGQRGGATGCVHLPFCSRG